MGYDKTFLLPNPVGRLQGYQLQHLPPLPFVPNYISTSLVNFNLLEN